MSLPQAVGRLRTVLAGRAVPCTRPGSRSAIAKIALAGAVDAGPEGLAGDEQGDRRIHGGPDKAVHCYAWAHYAHWREVLPGTPWLDGPGAFGENFSVDGMDEADVCIGDRWQVGGVLFEVSQGRQPCWKLNDRFGVPDMAARVQRTLRAGWYLRVLEPGRVQAGDAIVRIAQPHPDWPLARLLRAIRDRDCEPALLQQILALPLTDAWRRLFRARLQTGQVESWEARLRGDPPTSASSVAPPAPSAPSPPRPARGPSSA